MAIVLSLFPVFRPRRLPVYQECLTHPSHAHVVRPTDIPSMMVGSLVSVNFDLTYNRTDGLVTQLGDICVIKS